MHVLTEKSPYGHYGVWSLVPREVFDAATELLAKNVHGYEGNRFDNRTGFDYSLIIVDKYDQGDTVKLAWSPDKLGLAMKSIGKLNDAATYSLDPDQSSDTRSALRKRFDESDGLNLVIARADRGWHVHASLGGMLWDVIEQPFFNETIIPKLIQHLVLYWEDQVGTGQRMGTTEVHDGADGKTLQIYHSNGNGLWISGSRKYTDSHQISDHNTDSEDQAFAHVYALCILQKLCREHLAKQ